MRKHGLVAAAVAAVTAVTALSLTACGSTKSPAPGASATTLTVVRWKGEGTNVADMPALNAAFTKAHPEITLDFKYVDNPNYDVYNNPRLAAGTAADVIMLDRGKMNEWASQGFLADLSDQPWVKRMLPDLAPFNQYQGKTYQFNAENIPIGLYVNPDLLQKAGVTSVPKTWPEFLTALAALKAKGIGGFIVPNKGGWIGIQLGLLLAAQHVDPGWPAAYDAGSATFDPSWSPVVDKIKQLFSSGAVDPQLSLGLDPNVDGIPQFEAGKWAFMIQGAWALDSVSKASSFKVTLNAFPGGDAGSNPKAFNFVGVGWGVNAKAKNKTAALEYVDFMTQAANATAFLKAESAFTTLSDVPSPTLDASAPIAAAMAAGDIVPSYSEELNAPDAEKGISQGIENVFVNPTAPASDSISMMNAQVKPTKLG